MLGDIYRGSHLKYTLIEEEYKMLDEAWDFFDKIKFSGRFTFLSDYRKFVIKDIRSRYTPEDFYEYESIINKLFWNLRWIIFPLWDNKNMTQNQYIDFVKNNYGNTKNIPYKLLLCNSETYKDDKDLEEKLRKNKIFETTYYRSFINKLIIVDKKNKNIISKQIEGSAEIFSKNYFNLMTMTIMFDRKLYEKIMNNPFKFLKMEKISMSQFYYEYDYGFPNLNYCTYEFGTKEQRMDRIKKMYYHKGPTKAFYWFKLIL